MTERPRCGHCLNPLPDNTVSDYFCSQEHQDLWYQLRSSEPLDTAATRKRWGPGYTVPSSLAPEY